MTASGTGLLQFGEHFNKHEQGLESQPHNLENNILSF
jgi:hypothetical protein